MQIKIVIEKEFETFGQYDENLLRHALAHFLHVPEAAVRIVLKARGSVAIVISMPERAAYRLVEEYQLHRKKVLSALASFTVSSIELEDMLSVPPPDLTILVQSEEDNALSFHLKAKDPSLGLHYVSYGRVTLSTYLESLLRRIKNLSAKSEIEELAVVGCYLFEAIIPENLREVLWSLKDKLRTVIIQSDEDIIPWELLKFSRREETGPFFCEAFVLSRWIPGYQPRVEFFFDKVAWISPQSSGGLGLRDDRQQLETLGYSVTTVPATLVDIHNVLASGAFDVLHFATQASQAKGLPGESRLYPKDYEALTPEALIGVSADLGMSRPLVFWNDFHYWLNREAITSVCGWATQFISAGCGAFIGSYWNLGYEGGNSFQKAFYENFVEGYTMGESVSRARRTVRVSGDLTWLSYALYGHPEARLNMRGAGAEHDKMINA